MTHVLLDTVAQVLEAEKPKAYVPPHLRGKANAAPSQAALELKAALNKQSSGPKKLTAAEQVAIVGSELAANGAVTLTPEELKKQRNKERAERKKKQAAKQKEEEEAEARAAEAAKEAERQRKAQEDASRLDGLSEAEKQERRRKVLTKKLRQVDLLKEQREAGQPVRGLLHCIGVAGLCR